MLSSLDILVVSYLQDSAQARLRLSYDPPLFSPTGSAIFCLSSDLGYLFCCFYCVTQCLFLYCCICAFVCIRLPIHLFSSYVLYSDMCVYTPMRMFTFDSLCRSKLNVTMEHPKFQPVVSSSCADDHFLMSLF
jgi:hypothetical protein